MTEKDRVLTTDVSGISHINAIHHCRTEQSNICRWCINWFYKINRTLFNEQNSKMILHLIFHCMTRNWLLLSLDKHVHGNHYDQIGVTLFRNIIEQFGDVVAFSLCFKWFFVGNLLQGLISYNLVPLFFFVFNGMFQVLKYVFIKWILKYCTCSYHATLHKIKRINKMSFYSSSIVIQLPSSNNNLRAYKRKIVLNSQ